MENVFCYTTLRTAGVPFAGVVSYPLARVRTASTKPHQEDSVSAGKTTQRELRPFLKAVDTPTYGTSEGHSQGTAVRRNVNPHQLIIRALSERVTLGVSIDSCGLEIH